MIRIQIVFDKPMQTLPPAKPEPQLHTQSIGQFFWPPELALIDEQF